jgi:hypothetical protein
MAECNAEAGGSLEPRCLRLARVTYNDPISKHTNNKEAKSSNWEKMMTKIVWEPLKYIFSYLALSEQA